MLTKMAESNRIKDIFISYGREEGVLEFVKQLKADLEANGVSVWLDADEIPTGCDFHVEIEVALKSCRALIPVLTKKYVQSRYCKGELYVAYDENKALLPVIYEDGWNKGEKGAGVNRIVKAFKWAFFRPNRDDHQDSLKKLVEGTKLRMADPRSKVEPEPNNIDVSDSTNTCTCTKQGDDRNTTEEKEAMTTTNEDEIQHNFALLIDRLRNALKQSGIEAADINRYLIDMKVDFQSQVSDLETIFDYLKRSHLWSHDKINLVEGLNKRFLGASSLSIKQHILDYKGKFNGYLAMKKIIDSEYFVVADDSDDIEDPAMVAAKYGTTECHKLKVKLELGGRKLTEVSLLYMAELWESFQEEYELPSLSAQIDYILETTSKNKDYPSDVYSHPLTFSKDMSDKQLAQWLRNHPSLSGADYGEDISKLRDARINGHVFLRLNESRLERFHVSVGFQFAIMDIIEDMVHKSSHQPPSSERLSLQQQPPRSSVATPRTIQQQLTSSTAGQQTKLGHTCPICLEVLRDPYQATCCGKNFCKECIHPVKAANKPCPTCRTRDFHLFPDKRLQQVLNDIRVDCTHKNEGCEWTGELRELDNHLSNAHSGEPPRANSRQRTTKVEGKVDQTIVQPPQPIAGTYTPVDAKFTMENFDKHKRDKDTWYSPDFYTHPKGYKMCLRVDANGDASGRGTHLSVFVCLMQGEFDDQLKWPFQGDITIQLVNQKKDRDHVIKKFYSSNAGERACERVMTTERINNGWGIGRFLPHAELQPRYLKKNCIKFYIKKIDLY